MRTLEAVVVVIGGSGGLSNSQVVGCGPSHGHGPGFTQEKRGQHASTPLTSVALHSEVHRINCGTQQEHKGPPLKGPRLSANGQLVS